MKKSKKRWVRLIGGITHVGRSLTFDRGQLVRVVHLVHAKDECVEDREHHGHQSEADPVCQPPIGSTILSEAT